jgi:hypothetical protein
VLSVRTDFLALLPFSVVAPVEVFASADVLVPANAAPTNRLKAHANNVRYETAFLDTSSPRIEFLLTAFTTN